MVLPLEYPVLHILLQGERIPEGFSFSSCMTALCNIAEYGTDSKFCTAFSFYDVESTDLILRTDLIKIHFIRNSDECSGILLPVFRQSVYVIPE